MKYHEVFVTDFHHQCLVTLSPCYPVTLSPCYPVTLLPCYLVTLLPCYLVTSLTYIKQLFIFVPYPYPPMKPIIFLFSILILAVAPLRSTAQVTLYPPLNLQAAAMECSVYLTWEKPELPGGGTPPGLLGYNLYRDGNILEYVSGQDTTVYIDIEPPPCPAYAHNYWVTAYYDLTSYGFPGQFGESATTDTLMMNVSCDRPMPFIELWDQGTFAFNGWTSSPSQGNWTVTTSSGDPAPAASFAGSPTLTGYDHLLQSPYIDATLLTGCINLYIDFDLKLENGANTGTENLAVEAGTCDTSEVIATFQNNTDFGWQHYTLELNDFRSKYFRVGFRAFGQNSGNIQQWLVDNIIVSFKCRPPVNLTGTIAGNSVTLLWDPPFCDMGTPPSFYHITGYNVYMSDSLGNAPFHRITGPPCTDDSIVVNLAPGWDPEVVRFYVTDLQHDSATLIFLCESEPSDTVAAYYVGIDPKKNSTCNIYPNPNKGMFTADVPSDAVSFDVIDGFGRIVRSEKIVKTPLNQLFIDISDQPPGIYILSVTTKTGISRGIIVLY
jgi:hypothetical protein